MELLPREEYRHNKEKTTEIANHIEMIPFRVFVANWKIFFEKFGEPVHSEFKHEKSMIQDFLNKNPLLSPPADLAPWCIRIVLMKEKMIFKHMDLETIYHRLRKDYPGIFIVYNSENSDQIILRIYCQSSGFIKKGDVLKNHVVDFKNKLLDTVIRGIYGIRAAMVSDMEKIQSYVSEDGTVATRKVFNILCTGSNISGVLDNSMIDPNYVKSDNVKEIERIYGIEAARYAIINEIRENIKGLSYGHYSIYADEMTCTGMVTPIERSGLGARELDNIMLRASNEAPIDVLSDSAVNAMTDVLGGISAPLILGRAPKIGSLWNQLAIDQDMIRKNTKTIDEHIASIIE